MDEYRFFECFISNHKPQPSSSILLYLSSMASQGSGDFTIVIIILLLIIGIVVYSYLNRRRVANKQKELMKALRASPKFIKDAPALVHGPAAAPDCILPTTGEHVAFYGMFVISRESEISGTHSGTRIGVDGITVPASGNKITDVKGFRFFESSGDFTVMQGGSPYFVRFSSIMAYFAEGAAMVSFAGDMMKQAGLSEQAWNDFMNFQVGENALKTLCGFEAPIVTQHAKSHGGGFAVHKTTDHTSVSITEVRSRIDSRIHYLMAGHNIPQGILDLIAKRGITLEEKEEVIVVETVIPLNKEVFAFGTFDGGQNIAFADSSVQLLVSYQDPALE
ncbi:MAG: hypothetical protein A4E34_00857 [Methanoregula sp. PtaU1.Bin006]|nr:MAG: hypothetical protein A4E33_02021 [Methanoregula sp. PtaB.Bin085]OPY35329.1 MAG: hypothetical protein A4E34_00857 [Methanoregula sp. PtaU1.Bin006]